jgi:Leucine-rich repeat (LRR) protein
MRIIFLLFLLGKSFFALASTTEEENLTKFLQENFLVGTKEGLFPTDYFLENGGKLEEIERLELNVVWDFTEEEFAEYFEKKLSWELNFPREMKLLKKLSKIDLSYSSNQPVGGFKNLEDLPIRELVINRLYPKDWNEIFNISSLEVLEIVGNGKDSFGESLNICRDSLNGIHKLENLKRLTISGFPNLQKLPELPKSLTSLDLSENGFFVLPETITNLENLLYLNLSKNKLEELPNNFINLRKLSSFYASSNYLMKLPENISEIPSLNFIDLQNNRLQKLPENIFNKDNNLTKSILANYNYLSYIPVSLCDETVKEILVFDNFFEELPSCLSRKKLYQQPFDVGFYSGKVDAPVKPTYYDLKIIHSFSDENSTTFIPIFGDEYNISSYNWSFGDGEKSNLKAPKHKYQERGKFIVTLEVELENSQKLLASKEIFNTKEIIELKANNWYLLSNSNKLVLDNVILNFYFPEDALIVVYRNDKWIYNPEHIYPSEGFWIKSLYDFDLELFVYKPFSIPKYKISNKWQLFGNGEVVETDNLKSSKIYIYQNENWILNPERIYPHQGLWIKK